MRQRKHRKRGGSGPCHTGFGGSFVFLVLSDRVSWSPFSDKH
jgi:hypothetical protein